MIGKKKDLLYEAYKAESGVTGLIHLRPLELVSCFGFWCRCCAFEVRCSDSELSTFPLWLA